VSTPAEPWRRRARRSGEARLNPHGPLVLDTRELGRRAGSLRTVSRTAPAPPGLGLELAGVVAGAPLELDLRLEAVMEGVLVTGSIRAPLTGECGRCLEPVADELDVRFQELYAYPGASSADQDDDEVSHLDGDLLDLEPAIRDAVVLALPLTPLCSPDCAGLCAQCGARLGDQPGHTHDQTDPRWAGLSTLGSQHEEE
jgi:uncharacterized protein